MNGRSRPAPGALAAALLGLALLPVALATPSPAGDNAVRVLSLPEALGIAAERNRDIGKAIEFRRQVEGKYAEERAAALPQITVGGELSRAQDKSQEVFDSGFGGPIETRAAQATLSQPLYTFGQIGAAIRAARHGFGTADAQLAIARQAAARDVTAAFYDVLLARELAGISAQTLAQRARHLDETRRKSAAGTATDYDVLAAEVAVANAKPEAIRAENLVRTSREHLRFLLGIGGQEVDAAGALDAPVAPAPAYDEALSAALANRPEVAEIRSRLGISEELVRIANAGDKPRLDLRSSLGWKSADSGGMTGDGGTWTAGLFLSYPIFDGFRARGRAAQARSDQATLRIEEARLLDGIALETRDAVNAVGEAAEIERALQGTVAQAERLLSLAEKGFEYGVKTRLEVQDAELSLRQARGGLARARRDHLVARVTLDYVTGRLAEAPGGGPGFDTPWRPATTILGIVPEVLKGEPRLVR